MSLSPATRAAQRRYTDKRRERARAAGLCIRCYVIPVRRWAHCHECRVKASQRAKRRWRRRAQRTTQEG